MAAPFALLALALLARCTPGSPPLTAPPAAPPPPLANASSTQTAPQVAVQATPSAAAAEFDHADFDALLKKHGRGDRIDYAALQADRAPLDAYLKRVALQPEAQLLAWPRAAQMAFWINAYNALTLRTIIDAYPIEGSGLSGLRFPKSSIRQLDDPWGKKHTVAGAPRSLDDLEHQLLRKHFQDARIHAAVNCASIGCPPLRLEAFTAAALETQLDEQMRAFVADPLRNVVDPTKKKIALSAIFDWFGEDFGTKANGKEGERALLAWLEKYGKPEWKAFLASFDPDDIDFLDYDWALNDVAR
ncbi:MAG: DUF547 domain-containing protein [Planctomycetes bacterium]|nr:DUF547 domain-containing protein [Planctomycetota bacterium]